MRPNNKAEDVFFSADRLVGNVAINYIHNITPAPSFFLVCPGDNASKTLFLINYWIILGNCAQENRFIGVPVLFIFRTNLISMCGSCQTKLSDVGKDSWKFRVDGIHQEPPGKDLSHFFVHWEVMASLQNHHQELTQAVFVSDLTVVVIFP